LHNNIKKKTNKKPTQKDKKKKKKGNNNLNKNGQYGRSDDRVLVKE
jgi:hypothetical protein